MEAEAADTNQFWNACSTLYTDKPVNVSTETISGNLIIQKTQIRMENGIERTCRENKSGPTLTYTPRSRLSRSGKHHKIHHAKRQGSEM